MSETGYCLGLHCGITFAGLKPASLFWLKDGQDKDMVYYRRCFAKKDFRFIAVKRTAGRKLFYVFHRGRLEEILFDKANREFLRGRGYNYDTVGGALKELKRRLERGDEFPHEVGLFLGYPLVAVLGIYRGRARRRLFKLRLLEGIRRIRGARKALQKVRALLPLHMREVVVRSGDRGYIRARLSGFNCTYV